MMPYDGYKTKRLRSSICDGQHIYTESVLQLCLFIQKVLKCLNISTFLSSKTILIPSFDDWLVMSTISVVAFDSTSE